MGKRLVLPEMFASPAQHAICHAGNGALEAVGKRAHRDLRRKQHMDVIRHDHIGMKVILAQLEVPSIQQVDHHVGDSRILQPDRPARLAVKHPVEAAKLLGTPCTIL